MPYSRKKVCAVIAAAGNSTRMGFDGKKFESKSKQFIELCGKTVIERSVYAFEQCSLISDIIISARVQDIEKIQKIISEAHFRKVRRIIEGGNTRQESVLNAVSVCDDDTDYIAIHDGARCLITPEDISKIVYKAFETGAATAAHKITDTVKYADWTDGENIIKRTVDRKFLWTVQTPQVFLRKLYMSDVDYMRKSGGHIESVTDDCSILEYAGHSISVVECSKMNIKITERGDIDLAEAIIMRINHGEK